MFNRKVTNNKNPLRSLGPLYHKYSFFGVENEQLEGIFEGNQKAKTSILTAYTAYAIAKAKEDNRDISFAELFCADGYYAMLASRLGASRSVGYDNDIDPHGFFKKAPAIAKALGLDKVEFINEDMQKLHKLPRYNIVANVGGLYHVSNPEQILNKSYKMAKDFLIVQTVVSMENNDPKYFQEPAPGWTWGSRYSRASFDNLIKKLNYKVIDSHFNELKGNGELSNRGSVYYLIKK
jgi:hypothetical protein